MNSGMKPNLIRSTGCTCESRSISRRPLALERGSSSFSSSCRKPMDFLPARRAITFSSPTNAPPQMNRMLVVSTGVNSWCGCLRPPCGGTLATVPFQDLQQRLLHALARNVAGDRRVLVLAADLVDFVDIDDALLAALHVPVGVLQQPQDDVLDVLAHVAGFGQRGGVHDRERHVQNLGQRLRQQASCRYRSGRSAGCWTSTAPRRVLRMRFMWMRLQWL